MKRELTAFHLKLIAITAMLINHLGTTLGLEGRSPAWYLLTETIGKLTFPIMAFLLVEGFHYSRDRRKYALRLAVFWLVSILPFHYLLRPDRPLSLTNNILYTLLIGLLLLMVLEKTRDKVLQLVWVLLFSLVTYWSDWGLLGIFLIAGFYQNWHKERGFLPPIVWLTAIYSLLLLLSYANSPSPILIYETISMQGLLLTLPLLQSYKGQRGYSPSWVKWGFYAFYPLHLCLLLLLRFLLFGQ